ncbi:MAG TPA: glycosyltransferase [Solirubrobacterales bacterium]|nr:glycosyltransferase [Solirubrobacterales bacterium]
MGTIGKDAIRIAAHVDAETLGGAERSLATLLRHLDPRFQVDLIVTDAAVGEFLAANREVGQVIVCPPVRSDLELGGIAAQLSAIRRLRPDVVHVNRNWIWAGQTGILGGLLSRGARVVGVEHAEPLPTGSRRLRLSRRLLATRMAAIVAVGDATARLIESYIGLPRGSVRTIHNGVEVLSQGTEARLHRTPRIGAIGRLAEEKGFEDLPHVLRAVEGAELLVVGEGEERGKLEALAGELGVADRFHLVGWRDDPVELLRTFDVLVQPSRREGSPPLAALEAMMVGVPVVAANVGSVNEAIEDDRTGILVPPRDPAALGAAVASLLGDPPRRARLASAARERIMEEFTATQMAARFEALYDEILN